MPALDAKPRLTWRRLRPGELDHERRWAGLLALGVGCVVVVPEALRLRLVCPLKALAGVPCLTCGGNRALSALVRLEPGAALVANPLLALALMACGLFVLYAAVVIVGRLPRLRLAGELRPLRAPVLGLVLGASVANWLYLVRVGI